MRLLVFGSFVELILKELPDSLLENFSVPEANKNGTTRRKCEKKKGTAAQQKNDNFLFFSRKELKRESERRERITEGMGGEGREGGGN